MPFNFVCDSIYPFISLLNLTFFLSVHFWSLIRFERLLPLKAELIPERCSLFIEVAAPGRQGSALQTQFSLGVHSKYSRGPDGWPSSWRLCPLHQRRTSASGEILPYTSSSVWLGLVCWGPQSTVHPKQLNG